MRTFVRMMAIAAILLVTVAGAAEAKEGKKKKAKASTVEFVNKTSWDIHHIFMSPSDEASWGPDQLGEDVLEVGGSFTLTGIDCNSWDIKVVDEDGDECVIEEVDLCLDTEKWIITNKDLLACQWASE